MKYKQLLIISTLLLSGCSSFPSTLEPSAITTESSENTATNPSETKTEDEEVLFDLLLLVNKDYGIESSFEPYELEIPDIPLYNQGELEKNYVSSLIIPDLEKLVTEASNEGIELFLISGYRSYERQQEIYSDNISNYGSEHTEKYSAEPGHSEHQTGLALDVSSPSASYSLTETFAYTEEGIWLAENAHNYGFIIRYPSGKEDITGYSYEPWHIRYVGVEAATYMYDNNLTLEEYIEKQTK